MSKPTANRPVRVVTRGGGAYPRRREGSGAAPKRSLAVCFDSLAASSTIERIAATLARICVHSRSIELLTPTPPPLVTCRYVIASSRLDDRAVPERSECQSRPRANAWQSCGHGVRAHSLRQTCFPRRSSHGLLHDRLVQVISGRRTPPWIPADSRGREHELPPPVGCRVRILSIDRERQNDAPQSAGSIVARSFRPLPCLTMM